MGSDASYHINPLSITSTVLQYAIDGKQEGIDINAKRQLTKKVRPKINRKRNGNGNSYSKTDTTSLNSYCTGSTAYRMYGSGFTDGEVMGTINVTFWVTFKDFALYGS